MRRQWMLPMLLATLLAASCGRAPERLVGTGGPRLAILPDGAMLAPGESLRFVVSPLTTPVTWRLDGRGTLDQEGSYRAPFALSGAFATVQAVAGGDIASASVVVLDIPPDTSACIGPGQTHLPFPGEYVYVEVLPDAIVKVAPVYPDLARAAGIEGTVVVNALLCRDGQVIESRVVQSVSGLDDAAVAAVEQWRFSPAMAEGQAVAIWIAIPVRFSLH